jgi:uncharacterized protein
MNKKFSHSEILLLLLFVSNASPIIGRTRLQKIVFLYENECHKHLGFNEFLSVNKESLFGFYPHNFGPFSKKLYDYTNDLLAYNFINSSNNISNKVDFFSNKVDNNTIYQITDIGKNYVESELLKYIDSIIVDDLSAFKNKYTSISLNDLIFFVYNSYEKYTEKSIIKEEVLG